MKVSESNHTVFKQWDPGGLMPETLTSQRREVGFDPWSEKLDPSGFN